MKKSIYDICNISVGGTPSTKIPEYWNGRIPWLSVNDFKGNSKFVYKTEKTITELGLKNSSTKILKQGDLIISARGTVGELAVIPFDMAFNQSCYGLSVNTDIITSDYLYYFLNYSINILKKKSYGSVFDTITTDTFKDTIINVPELDYQEKVCKILSKIDQKIENNIKINDNLATYSMVA